MSAPEIPGFEIIGRIGRGGMATVWKARQLSLDRIVAIKVLLERLAHDPEDIQRFQTEAQSAAKLKHPGIVQVYDARIADGFSYFVMEYVGGYTVGEWIRRKGVLVERDALLVAECVADALDYAWEKERIIHCDIKPDNVMIDADGTVKVADLGLARTIRAMRGPAESDEIMGTPAFMSPEQTRGDQELDCRTDIYATGAMLYYLLTGKLLFEGASDDEVMDRQVSDSVEDPFAVNPELSKPACWLIESMLAKDRDDRPTGWRAVRNDLERVKRGMMPANRVRSGRQSTVRRSRARTRPGRHPASPAPSAGRSAITPLRAGLIVLGVVVVFMSIMYRVHKSEEPVLPRPAAPTPPPSEDPERQAREMFEQAVRWQQAHPNAYAEATRLFEEVAAETRGTRYPPMAREQIARVASLRQGEISKTLATLRAGAAALVEARKYEEAARHYESYTGAWAAATLSERETLAAGLRGRGAEAEKARQEAAARAGRRLAAALDTVVALLLEQDPASARDAAVKVLEEMELGPRRGELQDVIALLEAAEGVDRVILDSFNLQRGEEVTLQLTSGTRRIVIDRVEGNRVHGREQLGARGTVGVTFGVADLATRERLLRMGDEGRAEVALVKGLMAFKAMAYTHARRYFGLTHPLLGDRLAARVGEAAGRERQNAGPEADEPPGPATQPGPPAPAEIDPGPRADADAVVRALLERNPELVAGAVTTTTNAAGYVERVEILSPAVKDIGPLAAFRHLRSLRCSPRRTMARSEICPLSDVSALKGLPLERLHLASTSVKDLTPLRGTALTELHLNGTEVSNLSPLKGMPLRYLYLYRTPVRDITPLSGMPLSHLNLAWTRVVNFAPLRGMHLTRLEVAGSQIRDLSVLKGMPLEALDLSDTRITDLAPLKGTPVRSLAIDGTAVRDFTPLSGLPLASLRVRRCRIDDLSVVAGMPLTSLFASDTSISDLGPLRGMPLQGLEVRNTRVTNLSPLSDLPLRHLDIRGTKITDFRPLASMPVESLYVDRPRDIAGTVLRFMPELNTVNGEAWKRRAGR